MAAQAPVFLESSVDFNMSLNGDAWKVLAELGTRTQTEVVELQGRAR